jgi:hypothetical protein
MIHWQNYNEIEKVQLLDIVSAIRFYFIPL